MKCTKRSLIFMMTCIFVLLSMSGSADPPDESGVRQRGPAAVAAEPITTVNFGTIPEGLTLRAPEILLDGDARVNGHLSVDGEIHSTSGGIKFPDGSMQVTAASDGAAYSNRIPDFTPPYSFTEVCIKDHEVFYDIHSASEPTVGGNCVPGDIGWIIERYERSFVAWAEAKMECLKDDMRLPEAFEYRYSCTRDTTLGLISMQDDWEWASNSAIGTRTDSYSGIESLIMANGGCNYASMYPIAGVDGVIQGAVYRCAK